MQMNKQKTDAWTVIIFSLDFSHFILSLEI